ncbi:hypothetical protein K491DRAFT_760093 [Lophiostoma macrostomum CBS 122681]|uniref:SRR1-like domain-containing protein n=1 Tax=Lophiostoma macrostomum CBS 122681 TaxID=1314788 RepID=A0A6A6SYL2_9PLEO|nr:hypothetical protein K491DRAFT_760093 [Lophiostoma macrostomum CBS 122681]
MLIEADNLAQKLNALEPGEIYHVTGFDGKIHDLSVPKFDKTTHDLAVHFIGYHELAKNMDANGNFVSTEHTDVVPYQIVTGPISRHTKQKLCHVEEGRQEPWDEWKYRWENGEWKTYSKALRDLVEKHKEKLKFVDQIVCFALGSSNTYVPNLPPQYEKELPARYIQHLAAWTIRKALQGIQKSDNPNDKPIPILAQDPGYCDNCKKVLHDTLGIESTSGCYDGFKAITPTSLVIVICPGEDICGMIADITATFDGPVAMLCDTIQHTDLNGKVLTLYEPWSRWDGVTEKNCKKLSVTGTADQMTETLWKYSEDCTNDYFGDSYDHLGMSHKEWMATKPPVAAQVKREDFPNTKQFEDAKAYSSKMYQAAAKIVFRDLSFYVKK